MIYLLLVDGSIKTFKEEGFFNYSTMLVREDINTLFVGAREAVYALNMEDISERISTVSLKQNHVYFLFCFCCNHVVSVQV